MIESLESSKMLRAGRKAVYPGSIPGVASSFRCRAVFGSANLPEAAAPLPGRTEEKRLGVGKTEARPPLGALKVGAALL
jgi:hypothetical protein